jgi:hypothetical protein
MAIESAGEHFDAITEHHRHPITKTIGKSGDIDVDRLDGVAPPPRHCGHQGKRLGAQCAGCPSEKQQVAHCGTVPPVRPGTTIAILLLIALLLVAGVVFVIRLSSVT